MEKQKFIVEIDGIDREASAVDFITIDNKEYVIYSVDNGDETSDLFYSKIEKDENGFDNLVDVEDETIKQKIVDVINSTLFTQ